MEIEDEKLKTRIENHDKCVAEIAQILEKLSDPILAISVLSHLKALGFITLTSSKIISEEVFEKTFNLAYEDFKKLYMK